MGVKSEYNRRYYLEHAEERRVYALRYYQDNKELQKKKQRERYSGDPEFFKEKARKEYWRYKEKNGGYRGEGSGRVTLRSYLRKFNITESKYWEEIGKRKGLCDCCGKRSVHRDNRVLPLCIDEDHENGGVRGFVCGSCNCGIGLLGDSVEGLGRALSYLKGSKVK